MSEIGPGQGRIVVSAHGTTVVFTELSSTYPLKLLSPTAHNAVAVAYVLTYGGGLVGGDYISLCLDCGPGAILVLLSQGSTKVFKTRPGARASGHRLMDNTKPTTQTIDATVHGTLILLPDPVTCFAAASYRQVQRFHMSKDSTIVILDWITSGRKSLGEEWAFSRYYCLNEVFVDGKRIARDVLLLDDTKLDASPLPTRTLHDRLSPYSCYANLILHGPLVQNVIRDLEKSYEQISVFKTRVPESLLWSLSPIRGGSNCVVRVAGKETETVKQWLGEALRGLEELIGTDVYRRAFTV